MFKRLSAARVEVVKNYLIEIIRIRPALSMTVYVRGIYVIHTTFWTL